MRSVFALALAGLLSFGLCAQAQAADVTQKAGNVSIELPDNWQVLPKAIMLEVAQGNPDIMLLAQGPDKGFPKLTVLKSSDPTTQAEFAKMDADQIAGLCKKFSGNTAQHLGKVETTCGRVENNGLSALDVQMTIPAQDNRPELVSSTRHYPNGGEGATVSAMFLEKDAAKFEAQTKKACASLKFIRQ